MFEMLDLLKTLEWSFCVLYQKAYFKHHKTWYRKKNVSIDVASKCPSSQSSGLTRIIPWQIIASHIIKLHASAGLASSDSKVSKEENWLKRYTVKLAHEFHWCCFVKYWWDAEAFRLQYLQVFTVLSNWMPPTLIRICIHIAPE